ncbi:MAG: hypothetical protein NC306_15155 [Butyrivibrio sp.]|nr:hypothetical protein [Butyrivibrio sp.]
MDSLMMKGTEMTTKAKILVLFANAYDMLTEDKKQMTGCSIHYMFWGENGEALMEQSEWNVAKPVGVQRAKCSIDASLRTKVPIAPALYEGEFYMAVGGDGKPVMKLKDISFISCIRVVPHVIPGLVVPGMVAQQPDGPADESGSSAKNGKKA